MELFLTALSGVAWTIVYIAAIRIGFKHETYAMPIAALSLNIAWEWIYSIHDLGTAPGPQAYITVARNCRRLWPGRRSSRGALRLWVLR